MLDTWYHNEVNEIDDNSGESIALQSGGAGANWADQVLDAAGNMTTMPQPKSLTNTTFDDGLSDSDHQDALIEWTVTQLDTSTLTASSRLLFDVDQLSVSHNVCDLAFDGDGLLHISSGDGGRFSQESFFASQDPISVYGALMRIDPTAPNHPTANLTGKTVSSNGAYSIRDANHFGADGDPDTLPEITALGLPSPFRMNYDSTLVDLLIGNVGGARAESIDRINNGDNAQWGRQEGSINNDLSVPLEPMDTSSLSTEVRYSFGDMNVDGAITVDDIALFKAGYDHTNGEGAFLAMLAVPEPSGLMLLSFSAVVGCFLMNVQNLATTKNRPLDCQVIEQ